MYISRLELENIKSYSKAAFDFAPGITAIRGENGAGKTTIIEAVAWVMFDMLDYTKEQFVRRGEKKGSVRVKFVSGLDGREYEIFRDSGSAYFASDPRLGAIVANKKEEVRRFIWQHLGLDQGTDLESLFRQAIGVPQGTFTAVFLATASARKMIFDRLLKVDEYRDAAAKLLDTSRFVEARISDVREQIARIDGELSRSESVAAEREIVASQSAELAQKIATLKNDLETARADFAEIEKQHKRVVELRSAAQAAETARERAAFDESNARASLEKAEKAASVVESTRPDSEKYLSALAEIQRLEKDRAVKDSLFAKLNAVETSLAALSAEARLTRERLDASEKAEAQSESLRAEAKRQEKLETELRELRERAAAARALEAEAAALDAQLLRLRQQFAANAAAIKEHEEKAALAAELIELEKRSGELINALAALQADLDRDERFQREIKNGLCPIISQKCLNLGEGETLESFVSSQFSTLRTEIGKLTSERNVVDQRLGIAREGQRSAAEVASLKRRNREIEDEGKPLSERSKELHRSLSESAAVTEELQVLEKQLAELADPRGRLRTLEARAAEKPSLQQKLAELEGRIAEFETRKAALSSELAPFAGLESELSQALNRRDLYARAHLQMLSNQPEADEVPARRAAWDAARQALEKAAREAASAAEAANAEAASFDEKRFDEARELVISLDRGLASETARHSAASQRLETLIAEIAQFKELKKGRDLGLAERTRLETVSKTTSFIRETLKEAAPQIARNYVRHVAVEANLIFREITGNGERTLKWNDDYSVSVEEDSYERPFVSLSGGEQMSAALAVRLALLKQLTEIRIAFFDEPTTNMDELRRENLAAEIRGITNFDQLFVISHDDTFDNYVDNVIVLGEKT